MNYGKITTTGDLLPMGNPFRLTVANPTETQKSLIAQLDGWLPVKETPQPPYNPETEYLVLKYEEQEIEGTKWAVQVWEVKPIEE